MGSYIHPSVLTKCWVVFARLVLKLGKLPAFIPRNSQLKLPVVPQNYIPCYTKLGISPNVLRWLLLPKKKYLGDQRLQAILEEQQCKNSRGKLEKQRWECSFWSGLGQDLVRRDFLDLQLIILGDYQQLKELMLHVSSWLQKCCLGRQGKHSQSGGFWEQAPGGCHWKNGGEESPVGFSNRGKKEIT